MYLNVGYLVNLLLMGIVDWYDEPNRKKISGIQREEYEKENHRKEQQQQQQQNEGGRQAHIHA